MKKFLCFIELGYTRVSVYVTDSPNGYFNLIPDDEEGPVIYVGLDRPLFRCVLDIYLHETFEMVMAVGMCRFVPSSSMSEGKDDYSFMFTHPNLSHFCASIAENLEEVIPKLRVEYDLYQKGRVDDASKPVGL